MLSLCLTALPQSSLASSGFNPDAPKRFAPCEPYWGDIVKAVERRFPDDFQYPAVWASQLYQESLCNPAANSPAGAGGFAQFMKATARDMSKRLGIDFDRYDARQAIDAGAYYQARLTKTFRRRGRHPEQAYELGAASYNSGLGNVLKSQKLCGGARLWAGVSACQDKVTGRHAAETITYVKRIKRWTNEMEDSRPWAVPELWRQEVTGARRHALADEVPVRRWFTGQSWCSYFPYAGGFVTAGHCHDEVQQGGLAPPFLAGLEVTAAAGAIDAAAYGVDFAAASPPVMRAGMSVETIGYPAGSDGLAYRKGAAYIRRQDGGESYEHGGWIVTLEAGPRPTFEREPVVGGQSGSPGLDKDGNPVCIVVNQNGQTDLTRDGRPDNSFDCVALSDAWEILR